MPGKIYNHTIVEGQLIGGLVQGIGQVMGEHCVYDESGQFLTGTFMDYYMPRADAALYLSLHDRPAPSPANPLGAMGAASARPAQTPTSPTPTSSKARQLYRIPGIPTALQHLALDW